MIHNLRAALLPATLTSLVLAAACSAPAPATLPRHPMYAGS